MRVPVVAAIMLAGLTFNLSPRGKAHDCTNEIAQGCSDHHDTIIINPAKDVGPARETQNAANHAPSGDTTPQWVLVVVGSITALVIGWQAHETRRAATAANRGIEIQISKDRARIRVEVEKLNLVGQNQPGKFNAVWCKLMNYGHTEAFIDNSMAILVLVPDKDIRANYADCKQLLYATESVPPQGRTPYFVMVPLEPSVDLTDDAVMSIKKAESFVHFYGFVNYHTVFKRDMRATVHLRWTMRWGGMIQGQTMEWWEPVGPPEENADVEVKLASRWWKFQWKERHPNGQQQVKTTKAN
jgi:hypothetical protein